MNSRSQRFRDRITREVFGAEWEVDAWDDGDDGFERSALEPQRLSVRTQAWQSASDAWLARTNQLASRLPIQLPDLPRMPLPQLSLPRVRIGRRSGQVVLLLLLSGLLVMLLDPSLPSRLLANALAAPSAAVEDDPVTPSGPLTEFADWRIAYAGNDDRLYVVSSDARTTLAGPMLHGLLRMGNAAAAGASPDGHRIAYATRASGLRVIDLTGTPATPRVVTAPAATTDFAWSPDGARLAVTLLSGKIAVLDMASGHLIPVPHTLASAGFTTLGGVGLLGWLDPAHLIVTRSTLAAGSVRLDALDARTGVFRPLATIATTGSLPTFCLASDGSAIFAYANTPGPGFPLGFPQVWRIDSASGEVRSLPGIEQTLDGPIVAAVWDADMRTLLVATRVPLPSIAAGAVVHVWTVDTVTDIAVPLRNLGIPLGTIANGGPLVFGAWDPAAGGLQSYPQLLTFSYSQRGKPTQRLIDGVTGSLTFLGFVRTA